MAIPNEPPIDTPKRKILPDLGEKTAFVSTLDSKFMKDEGLFKEKANRIRMNREAIGLGSMHLEMQSRVVPKIDDSFLDKRIDVLFCFDILDGIENEKGLRWCQGKVINIISGKKKPTVEVLWDAIPELNIEQHRTIEVLPGSKWNKDTEGAWRMDIDISDDENGN